MFTPSQLEQLPIEVEKHFRELEIRVMSDIIRRIKMNSEITRTADYQLHRMSQLGAGSEEIKKSLEKALKSSGLRVDTIYDEVIAAGYAYDEKLYNAVGVKQTPFTENEELQQLISAVKTQTNDELKNITGSLGFAKLVDGKRVFEPIADYYQKTLDTAFYDISTGLFDYNSVIKRVVQEMTNSGLRSVTYETGWSNRVDVAARRAIMTGVNQVTAHISDKNAEELGTEYFEVSWHGTARPSHQEWQGKVYTKQELIDICGLGSVEGLCGSNCRHSYYAYIPGVSERVYTDEELELLNAKENLPREYNGKQYTAYEATQHQRKLETLMRKQRQDIKLYKDAGVSEEIVIAAQSRYRATMHEYVKFSKEMDLPQQMQRVYVDGLKNIGGHGRLKAIKGNRAEAIDFFNNYADMSETITRQEVFEALKTSEVGRETLEYIVKSRSFIQFDYQKKDFSHRGEEESGVIYIYMANNETANIAAQTVIHEVTHKKYKIGYNQWSEVVCFARERMHIKNKTTLTIEEKRDIIKLVKANYPELKWRRGGTENARAHNNSTSQR